MAIEYGVIFPSAAPILVEVLKKTASQNEFELTEDKDGVGYWLASGEETFFYIKPGPTLPHSKLIALSLALDFISTMLIGISAVELIHMVQCFSY
ncbi:hypothetical protein FNT36_14965 [Hymenobacter setariae]|uniref:Uncharacterized protein n=1 Tax=Hymenobacter setariae TaxID=2594794 RepID=A0A558BR25_9BACT|nr:hypothetical protein [Hymenobacter setariae]TVT38970.1 hypothetical protein FNT36_14965 [Hymenobacter setariae]